MDTLKRSEQDVKRLTFRRPSIHDECIREDNLLRCCPLDQNLRSLQNLKPASETTLGNLCKLPLEIQHMIVSESDVQTVTMLRAVSRAARLMVDGVPQYKLLIDRYSQVMRAVLSLELGPWITIRALHAALDEPTCSAAGCGHFGVYFHLLRCCRICYSCMEHARTFCPMRVSRAKEEYGIGSKDLRCMPVLRSVPGAYSACVRSCKTRTYLVDPEHAKQAGIRRHGSEGVLKDFITKKRALLRDQYLAKIYQAAKDFREGCGFTPPRKPNTPEFRPLLDGESGNALRYMVAVHAPWYDQANKRVEVGLLCLYCRYDHSVTNGWTRMFTVDGLWEHLKTCGKALDMERRNDTSPICTM